MELACYRSVYKGINSLRRRRTASFRAAATRRARRRRERLLIEREPHALSCAANSSACACVFSCHIACQCQGAFATRGYVLDGRTSAAFDQSQSFTQCPVNVRYRQELTIAPVKAVDRHPPLNGVAVRSVIFLSIALTGAIISSWPQTYAP
jgi:hypothetical protein